MPMPPSTGRPAPVMKRAASEQRKTTASAMSETSPSRPSGVCSTTAPTAASRSERGRRSTTSAGELHPHVGRHQAGIDAVDPDAVAELARFHRGDAGHPVDRGLGGGIAGDPGKGDGRRDRGDADDRAALARRAAGLHGAEGVLHAERRAHHIDLAHAREVRGLDVDHERGDLDAGVVDENVVAAELADGLRDRLFPARFVRDVERSRRPPSRPCPQWLSQSPAPASARMSPIITDAPAAASASAMPAPRPRAPPVTIALRPVRSNLLMGVSSSVAASRPSQFGGRRRAAVDRPRGSAWVSSLAIALLRGPRSEKDDF